ncbi:arylsulfatase [Sedimentisphaera salicampi]|uniref:arylsulfatase n=1 Tax=Sedimentisphaera salicampi TaxID=1941349 RepID=UPI000B9A6410|nr:arylsulfatase [Sedimentisphaera salicampi]OXU15833.1 Arylsulfatase [Sedimentisphaera salicampi]
MSTRREFMKSTAGILASYALTAAASEAPVKDKPNILLIMADDMGYSDAECYGGEVRTPNLSALADNGLRFTQHYSSGRCWPSRACLLTGYYAQHIRRDSLPGIKKGKRPSWAPTAPHFLKHGGYKSYHSGKWHIDGSPEEGGFDRTWGNHNNGCDWDRFFDSKQWQEGDLKAPVEKGEKYYSTTAIADHAIACLKLHKKNNPDKPFFQYMAFYSPHFPLQAIQKDIESYQGVYRKGWDAIRHERWERMKEMGIVNCGLSEREANILPHWNMSEKGLKQKIGEGEAPYAVAWNRLTETQKEFQAKKMAIHAAMITRMDIEIGRVVRQLKKMGVYENTLILFASDNGASAEQFIRGDGHNPDAPLGSAESYLCLGPGWSTAANTPFRLHKHWNHEGGISSPLIAHWPKGIKDSGELRHDPSHFIDILPTCMDAAGLEFPDKTKDGKAVPKRSGKSLLASFREDGALKHKCLWWAHANNRAFRKGDWKISARRASNGNTGPWELYNLKFDRCEMNNLASKYPEKVNELASKWHEMAEGFKRDLNS